MKECKVCGNEIHDNALKCIHCNEFQNFRRHLKFPQNALALTIALISVITVLIPVLRNAETPMAEEHVKFSWLYASSNAITLLLQNDSDEDAFIQEMYFLNPLNDSTIYLDRLSKNPRIPKKSIIPYEVVIYNPDVFRFIAKADSIVLWINWRSVEEEYAYNMAFENNEQNKSMERLAPLLTTYGYDSPSEQPMIISDLYFGKDKPDGVVTESMWNSFKDSVIAKKFPAFTELNASGMWTGIEGILIKENTALVRIIHNSTDVDFDKINEIVVLYKEAFDQESVLVTKSYDTQVEFR